MPIYRWVEERLGSRTTNVMAAGGRNNLLGVYKQRQKFADLPVAFVADQDMWLFSGIPSGYDGIIWTEGYSIENDLYADADMENLLTIENRKNINKCETSLSSGLHLKLKSTERKYKVSYHPNDVVKPGQTQMDENFIRCHFRNLGKSIVIAYQLKLRGKLLFKMLIRFLSAQNRQQKYSYCDLYDNAFGMISSFERSIGTRD